MPESCVGRQGHRRLMTLLQHDLQSLGTLVPIARIAIRVCPKGYRPRIEERIADNRAQLQPSTLAVADSVMYREALACAAEARG